MKPDNLSLVLADNSGFEFYYAIKSESQSIYWSGFSVAPDKTHLLNHYTSMLHNKSRLTYFLKELEIPLGYLCIDKDLPNRTCEISYGISSQYAGRGLAKAMIRLWLANIEDIFTTVVAWIAESNVASVKTVIALDFQATDEFEYRQFAQCPELVKFVKYIRTSSR